MGMQRLKSVVAVPIDSSVGRFRVQWTPEVCSHNQTRTTEKIHTEVTMVTISITLSSFCVKSF